MHHFADSLFFSTVFKFFNFKRSDTRIKRVFYRNGVYEGEVIQDTFVGSSFVPHGVGTLISSQATCVYGCFKDGELDGEANVFLNNGGFLRGPFEKGVAHGQFVYVTYNGDIYLMNLETGVLNGHVTFMPQNRPVVFLLSFTQNRLASIIRSYDFPPDAYYKCKIQILREYLEKSQMNDCLLSERDITTKLKRIDTIQKFVGSYDIGQKQYMYNGMFDSKLQFCGLGVLLQEDGRVEIGNFQGTKLHHLAVIFEKTYMYFGFVDHGVLNGKVVVKSLSKNAYKTCIYEKGRFDREENEGTDMPCEPLFQFTIDNYSNQSGLFRTNDESPDEAYSTLIDEEVCLDFFDEFIQQLPDSTCTKSEQQDSVQQLPTRKPSSVIKGVDQKFTFRAKSREVILIPKPKFSFRSSSEVVLTSLVRPSTASNFWHNLNKKPQTSIISSQRFPNAKGKSTAKKENVQTQFPHKVKTKPEFENSKKFVFPSTKVLSIDKPKLNTAPFTRKLSLQNNITKRLSNKVGQRRPSGSENNFLGNRNTSRYYSNLITLN